MLEGINNSKSKDFDPNPNGIEIVKPSINDWQILRDMKLRSLDIEPLAFDDPEPTKEKWGKRTEQEWKDILTGQRSDGVPGETITLFAKQNGEYLGMIQAIIPPSIDTWTFIQHVYVEPNQRGKHIGQKLVSSMLAVLEQRDDVGWIGLNVIETQIPARALYESLGFVKVKDGIKREKRGEEYYTDTLMRYFPQES